MQSKMLIVVSLFFFFSFRVEADASSPIELFSEKSYSRIALKLDTLADHTLEVDSKGFKLTFKQVGLIDLGVPFGGEGMLAEHLKAIHDDRIDTVRVEETREALVVIGTWNYPKGDRAPYKPKTEYFEFWDKSPRRFVLDFWHPKGITVGEIHRREKVKEDQEKRKALAEKMAVRKAAQLKKLKKFETANELTPFCDRPFDPKLDVEVGIRPAHDKFEVGKYLPINRPDGDYPYLVPKGSDSQAKHFRLALKLYHQGKFGLAIKAVEQLLSEFPKTKYLEDSYFLKGNALARLGLYSDADQILARLVSDFPESPTALYSAMYLGARRLVDGEYLKAVDMFLWLKTHYPEHRLTWAFHFASAEALFQLKQTDRAEKEYEWIVQRAEDQAIQAQAALSMGDLYMDRKEYDQAIAAYFRARKYYPEESEHSPYLRINRAEALYQLGELEKAQGEFKGFDQKFPGNPMGWRAILRLAEISGRSSTLKSGSEEFRTDLEMVINRYPTSEGANVSRLHLMDCGNHGGFDWKSAERFFDSVRESITKSVDVDSKDLETLLSITEIRTALSMKNTETALKKSADLLDRETREELQPEIRLAFLKSLRLEIIRYLDGNDLVAAASLFDKYEPMLSKLHSGDFVDDYLMRLARSSTSSDYIALSQRIINYVKSQNMDADKRMPASGDQEKRLSHSEEVLVEAVNLWRSRGIELSDEISDLLENVSDESAYSIYRELLRSRIAYEKKDYEGSMQWAEKALLLTDRFAMDLRSRIEYWKAELSRKLKRPKDAEELITSVSNSIGVPIESELVSLEIIGIPKIPNDLALSLEHGELLEAQGRWSDAAGVYQSAIDRGLSENKIRYALARALLKSDGQQSHQRGVSVLRSMAEDSQSSDFWKEMAVDSLKNIEAREGSKL